MQLSKQLGKNNVSGDVSWTIIAHLTVYLDTWLINQRRVILLWWTTGKSLMHITSILALNIAYPMWSYGTPLVVVVHAREISLPLSWTIARCCHFSNCFHMTYLMLVVFPESSLFLFFSHELLCQILWQDQQICQILFHYYLCHQKYRLQLDIMPVMVNFLLKKI